MKRKIYIAGKMTGLPFYNYNAFYEAENKIRQLFFGCEIVNPARIGYDVVMSKDSSLCADDYVLGDSNPFLDDIILAEMEALATCNCIYILKGWETSKGTRQELKYAIEHNFEIILEK